MQSIVPLEDFRIENVLQAIKSDPSVRIPDLARRVNLSASRLGHLFKARVGLSLNFYLADERLEKAAHLLRETDMRVKEITYSVGYTHHSVGNPANHNEKPAPLCTAMLAQLSSMHGNTLDGTPVVITANELNFLEGSDVGAEPLGPNFPNPPVFSDGEGCMQEGQLDTGGADSPGAVWDICPTIPDPTNGAIAPDAFLDSVRFASGSPVDIRFNQNFACLKVFGLSCNQLTAAQLASSQLQNVFNTD